MRRALFGTTDKTSSADSPAGVGAPGSPPPSAPKRKTSKAFTSGLQVTLRVGNVFEGETELLTYDANTLSTLLAEQEATKFARKKYRYVELVSVKPTK